MAKSNDADVSVILVALNMYEASLIRRINAEKDADAKAVWEKKLATVKAVGVRVAS